MPARGGYAPVDCNSSCDDHSTSADSRALADEDRASLLDTVDDKAELAASESPPGTPAINRCRVWRVMLPLAVLLIVLVTQSFSGDRNVSSGDQIVILISCDGFRADYRYRAGPTMRKLMNEGVQAEFMRPAFPSKTFPNHYTLATGLWPESHGIVGNSFIIPSTGEVFSMRSKDPTFWGGEPLWVTAEKAGVRSAPAMWPGADVNMSVVGAPGDGLPSYSLPYSRSINKTERVAWVLEHLARPVETQPRFLTLYMEDMDDAGHQHGPDSPEVAKAILEVDSALEALLDGLQQVRDETRRRVNVIVVGDHGMVDTSSDRVVMLPELREDPELFAAATSAQFGISPVLGLRPGRGREQHVLEKLNAAISRAVERERALGSNGDAQPRLSVALKTNLPARFHFGNDARKGLRSNRIPPIIGVVAEGWTLQVGPEAEQPQQGSHGYDNQLHSMATHFIGWGPAFAATAGSVVPAFDIVEVYGIIGTVLGLTRLAPNNGTAAVVHSVLGSIKHGQDDSSD